MAPSELNAVARFCMSPDDVLSQFLDNPERVGEMFGRYTISRLNSSALREAACLIKAFRDGRDKRGIVVDDVPEDVPDNRLQG